MIITKRDVEMALHPELQRQHDKLVFANLVDTYGPVTVLTWLRNCAAIANGETLPSPGTRWDPRR